MAGKLEEVILTRNPHEELDRACTALAAVGCDFALLSSLANVTYVSGFEVPVQVGALAELTYASPLALCSVSHSASWLIVGNADAAAAQTQSRLDELLPFDTFDSFNPTDSGASFLEMVGTALRSAGLANSAGTIGVEARTMPHAVSALLATEFPKLKLLDVAGAMQQARLIKTEREIALLRRASHIVDIGHITLAELVQEAGRTEFEMWAEIRSRMYQAVGHEIPVTGELVTGPRSCTVAYPNGPRPRTTEPGDAALMDISPRVDGYWSDCTNTHVIGGVEPTAKQRKYAKASQAACEATMAALRPGNRASDAWTAAETAFQKHGLPTAHYAGHQIGVVVNELPRLVAYDHTPIEAGMVFSIEPGAYEGAGGSFGARSEKMVLVTPSGPEILSKFEWGIK
jgi:Xaa-Pro aminopeptidase